MSSDSIYKLESAPPNGAGEIRWILAIDISPLRGDKTVSRALALSVKCSKTCRKKTRS